MSELIIPIKQYARTAAQLATENPILVARQLVIESDTGKMKLGNGTTAYNSLPYLLVSGNTSQYVRGDGSLATFPSIPSISGLVPYTGANANVNLGTNTITANQLIKSGGTASQFLKADGSIDSTAYLTTISGITAGGELSGTYANPSLVNSAVTGKVLTGLSVSGSAVVSTDSVLTAVGKLQNQVNALAGGVSYQGTWNASTNTPTLTSSVGTKGYYYVVSVEGSTNLNGITDWKLGDWAIYDGTVWQKVDNTDAVVSVNGYTGIVTLAKADIGLGNVENTALSTWAGSSNITTLGTIGTGVWQGSAIGDTYISSAATWNAKIGGSLTTGYLPVATGSGTVGNSAIFQNASNVGIGTTSPLSRLHIANSSTGAVQLYIHNTNGSTGSSSELVFGVWNGAIPTGSGNPGPSAKITAINTDVSTASTDLAFHTYASSFTSQERLRITSTGNVLINTTTDNGAKLQVNGDISVKTNILLSAVTPYFAFNDTSLGDNAFVQYGVNSGATSSGVYFNIFNQAGRGFSITRGGVIDFELTTAGVPIFRNMPTSAAGLPSGALWNNGGVVNIV